MFEPITLNYIGTLPKPYPLGLEFGLRELPRQRLDDSFPDCVGLMPSYNGVKLLCVYADRSMILWDISESKQVKKIKGYLPHADVVWGVEVFSLNLRCNC